jgi:hypothetical protein
VAEVSNEQPSRQYPAIRLNQLVYRKRQVDFRTPTTHQFRPANGTTVGDLVAVRDVLRPEAGWMVELITDGDAPWFAATGPDDADWAIGRQDGQFFAVPGGDDDWHCVGIEGLQSAADAAAIISQGAQQPAKGMTGGGRMGSAF